MATQVKRYNIVVRGKVQDVGFRDYIIALANIANLKGYIFNDIDGTVKLILEGAKDTVNSFLNEIKTRKYVTGVEIESLQQKELSDNFDLPVKFVRLSSDEMYDIDRKLGIGNELLANIKKDTAMLSDINKNTAMLPDIKRDTAMLFDINKNTAMLPDIKRDTAMLSDINKNTAMLPDIKRDTAMLPDIKKDTGMLPDIKNGIYSLNTKIDSFLDKQSQFNNNIIEHNLRLEKILEKLVEK